MMMGNNHLLYEYQSYSIYWNGWFTISNMIQSKMVGKKIVFTIRNVSSYIYTSNVVIRELGSVQNFDPQWGSWVHARNRGPKYPPIKPVYGFNLFLDWFNTSSEVHDNGFKLNLTCLTNQLVAALSGNGCILGEIGDVTSAPVFGFWDSCFFLRVLVTAEFVCGQEIIDRVFATIFQKCHILRVRWSSLKEGIGHSHGAQSTPSENWNGIPKNWTKSPFYHQKVPSLRIPCERFDGGNWFEGALPLRGTDEESFAERSLVAKKILRDRKPHIAERLDFMVYPPASLV